MKKLVTLIVMLAAASFFEVQAETIVPGANQVWWGYLDVGSKLTGLGVKSPDTYNCAAFIPGNHAVAGGKSIQAVRFGLDASNVKDVKVWIASSLPTAINSSNCIQVVDVPQSELGSLKIDVALNSPYAIPSNGVYVGYSFTITSVQTSSDAYPIPTGGSDAPNTLLVKTDNAVPNWTDLYGNGYGKLYLEVLLEGEFADNSASISDFGPVYAKVGETGSAAIVLQNNGVSPLSSIDYTIITDGIESEAQHVELASPISFRESATVNVSVPAEKTQCVKNKTLVVSKVNNNANGNSNNKALFTLYSLSDIIDRNVVVEEFTGTGCGWCPRGLVGMEKLRKTFGDRFVGIGLHQYNSSDAMYISSKNYAPLSFSGAPSCRIDRGMEIDPYYGSNYDICEDFSTEMAIPGLGSVEVGGMFDEAFTKVNATASAKALFDGNYSLEFVLVADGLKGTSNAWSQANYYSQYSALELNEDLSIFGMGGTYGKSSIVGWTFNDVAIASSYDNNTNQVAQQTLTAGERKDFIYTLSLPTSKTTLMNALKKDQIYVIAILLDSDGEVVNAAKKKVEAYDATAIRSVSDSSVGESARYSLDGRQIHTPQRGLNIIRMSDGSIKKVIVK